LFLKNDFRRDEACLGKGLLYRIVNGKVTPYFMGVPLRLPVDLDGFPNGPVECSHESGSRSGTKDTNLIQQAPGASSPGP
jgi:hypothetical protein